MKTIIVMSDSHGYSEGIQQIRQRHEADAIFHCGDSEQMATDAELQGITVVEGNCDQQNQFNQEEVVVLNGIRFFITHGHVYNVKRNLSPLSYRASELDADVICFGHSHMVYAEQDEHHLYVNPGSTQFPRQPHFPTYVILELDERTVHWSLWSIEGKKEVSRVFVV